MQSLNDVVIQTERLKLIPVTEDCADDIFANFDDNITTYMFPKTPKTIDDTLEFIRTSRRQLQTGEAFNMTILDKRTNEFIGGTGINHMNTKAPEFGIWVKAGSHGSKLGREAVLGLKDWAEAHLTYDHLVYPVDKDNIPSRKIAEACGGLVKRHYPKITPSGKTLNIVEYWIEQKTKSS